MRDRGYVTWGWLHAGLLACPLFVYAQSLSNGPQPLVRVHGTVVNAVTQAPVPRALVTSADQRMAVMTDEKGRFEFDVNLAAANGSTLDGGGQIETPYIVVKKPGYLSPSLPMALPLDDLTALKADQRLQMMPEASISGTVMGSAEDIPTGLTVQLLHRQLQDGLATWSQFQNQQVDARGRFHFGGLTPGDYKIVTGEWVDQIAAIGANPSKPVAGYPPQFYASGSTGATAAILHLGGGQNAVADLNLRVARYYKVEVPLAIGSPTKFVQVQVTSENGPGYTLGFDQKSQTVEGMLPDGIYHLTVTDVDAGDASMPPAVPEIRAGTGNLTVAGKPVHGAAIALVPAATIAVNVREDFTGHDPDATDSGPQLVGQGLVPPPVLSGGGDASNPGPAPLPRPVEIFLSPAYDGGEGNVGNFGFDPPMQQDQSTGDLKFSGVPPGRYRVQINARRGYVASATANGVDLLGNPLVVGSGSESSAISIILRDDSGTISGTVTGRAVRSRVVVPDYVIAYPVGDDPAAQPIFGNSPPDGKFTLANVVPGRYLVVAGAGRPPTLEYRNKDAMKAHESQGAIVDVSADETVTTSVKPLPMEPDYGGETGLEGED